MGVSNKGKNSIFSNLEVSKISEDSIVCGSVLFWNNGKSVILTAGHSCQMYSVSTGEFVKKLFVCESNIVSCNFHPRKQNSIIALSESGELKKYNLSSGKVEKSLRLVFKAKILKSQKVAKFSVNRTFYTQWDCEENYEWDDETLNDTKRRQFFYGVPQVVENFSGVLLWTSWSLHDEFQSHISVFCCSNGKQLEKAKLPTTAFKKCYKNFAVHKTYDKNILFVGMGGNFVVVCLYKGGGLFLCSSRIHVLGAKIEVTSLALHPHDFCFATGDSRGVIFVWRNILEKQPLKSAHNWHTVDIHDLAFSNEGVHLFSGGDENVLVKWSLSSNHKNFLPRLSSPIWHISVAEDNPLLAISLADNEIYIIDPNFQKVSVIKKYSMFISPSVKRCYSVLTSDPRNEHLVLSGRPGHLQFLSCKNNYNVLYSLDVGKANFMTGDKYLVNLEITHAKFNKTGSLMVTAEARKDNVLKEYRLKFWQYDESKQSFTLSTSMELPHDENDIHALEISSDDLVATSGSDKQFKLWAPFETSDLNVTKTVWSVLSVGKYKLLPCNPIDFCKDATLVAVGFGPSLTLWSTNTCSLKCSLIQPFKRDSLKFIKFGSDDHSHLIVAATDFNITTWNIITLTVAWTVNLEVSFLVGDFFNTYMCAFSTNNTLYVFSPGTTSPEWVMENVSDSQIIAAHSTFYINNENNSFHLYFLNSKQELFCVKCKEDEWDREMEVEGDTYVTRFSAQTAQKSGGSVVKSVSEYIPTKSKRHSHYVSSVLDAPAHTLPNPRRFCADFLESLTAAIEKPAKEHDSKSADPVDDDVIEIVDDDNGTKAPEDVSEDMLWKTVNDLFK